MVWSYKYKVVWSYNARWCGVTVHGGVELHYNGELSTRWCGVAIQGGVELHYERELSTRCCGVTIQGGVELPGGVEVRYKVLWRYNTRWCTTDVRKRGPEAEGGQLCMHCTFGFEMASAP